MGKRTREKVKVEFKSLPILTKEIGEDRVVKSLFAVMGHVDSYNDRIWPDAFQKTLADARTMDRIKVFWQHDSFAPPIGVPVLLREMRRTEMPENVLEMFPDATGALYGEVKYLDTPRGNEVLTGIREGAITENSIGYDPITFDFETDADGERLRNLRQARLWDVSPVNWGAQEAALTIGKKSGRLTGLYEELAFIINSEDVKAGRVLSARNLAKLQDALAMLQEVLTAAEPPTDEEDDGKALTEQIIQALALRERELSLVYGGLR